MSADAAASSSGVASSSGGMATSTSSSGASSSGRPSSASSGRTSGSTSGNPSPFARSPRGPCSAGTSLSALSAQVGNGWQAFHYNGNGALATSAGVFSCSDRVTFQLSYASVTVPDEAAPALGLNKDGASPSGVTEYVVEEMQVNGDSDPFFGTLVLSVAQPKFVQLFMAARADGTLVVRTSLDGSPVPVAETVLGRPALPFKVRWETQPQGQSLAWRATITDRNGIFDQSGSAPLLAGTVSKMVGLNRRAVGTSSFTISGLQLP
jgi:hypothetical protein